MTSITPEMQAIIDTEVTKRLAVKALDGEVALFDALDRLKDDVVALDEQTLDALRSRVAQEADGGCSLLHRYLDQRYLCAGQEDYDHTDAQSYLSRVQPLLGVAGDVLAAPVAGPAQTPENIVGIAGNGGEF
ncbi:hypothetical protein [Deinococcus ruber]|uniref:Uncharacterized protein n=1 Tax=Deinococcus ruber TaxID=1848197 RepID=A0A918F7S0_9DEIO|nr:hypothetical protein [Deinococcus ruber]GGR16915.1 hypothetical protein GCM10008957_31940 [Deinococcus ruber]